MSGAHTKENISAEFLQVFKDWAIKPTAIVTDNGANMIAAVKELNICNVRCAAHTLQLCINEALDKDQLNH